MFDDYVGSGTEADGLAEGGFDLSRDAEGVEDRFFLGVELDDVGLFGSDEVDIVEHLAVGFGVVYVDCLEGFGVEDVAEDSDGASGFFVDGDGGAVGTCTRFFERVFPAAREFAELVVEFGNFLAFG